MYHKQLMTNHFIKNMIHLLDVVSAYREKKNMNLNDPKKT